MNQRIERLLNSLREAIHDALGESNGVHAVLAELEREGHSPAFLVDVTLPEEALVAEEAAEAGEFEERELPSLEVVTLDGPLLLTASDEEFLRSVGVSTPSWFEYDASADTNSQSAKVAAALTRPRPRSL